ncbi:HU family DNA-binding protein [Parabacteroides sp. FAFU027]|uniref:HU family DNA-binding protein n=1 Tax=Parabacteroides sp. FAFU027 TaxID=2922715 RepID=UPI001FB004DB|nr:HU family DNA-binding protein [Parabacteroides sp. FAFU027]
MGFKYIVKTKRSGVGEKKAKYYAIPVRSGEIDTRRLAKELSERCTLTETDVRATLIGLVEIMEEYLHQGYSIRLEDLGRFTVSVTSDGHETPDECTPKRVKAKKICFMADKRLKENLRRVEFARKK